jgi:hypothetical protein
LPDYKEIKFLESTDNLREIISSASGRTLSQERANQISVCLEQGRLYFEAAQNLAWEIKPLLVYYGLVGFAKAIILSRQWRKLEDLPQSHGLKDVSPSGLINEMKLKVDLNGTFHHLNDSCAELEKLVLYDEKGDKFKIAHPTCKSEHLSGKQISLKEVFARIPSLRELYRQTFQQESGVVPCTQFQRRLDSTGTVQFEVDCLPFTDLSSLEERVAQLRARFRFLNDWRVMGASRGSVISFANLKRNLEFQTLGQGPREFRHGWVINLQDPSLSNTESNFPLDEITAHSQPVRGNLTSRHFESMYLIEPLDNLHISEVSLYFMGMFLLSCLVRYRPHNWANAIARRAFHPNRADDRALVLIESFVDQALEFIPGAVVVAINEPFC